MTPLRQRMIDDLRIRNRSPRTIKTYVSHVARFAMHFRRSPEFLGPEEIRAYQLHLIDRRVSYSLFNQAVCAIIFLYRVTLKAPFTVEWVAYARNPRKLPVVLSRDEVLKFLDAIGNPLFRVALTTAYATGLRVGEVATLRPGDIDKARMVIRVARGKGGKQREVPLAARLLDSLRAYYVSHAAVLAKSPWLFPGADPQKHICVDAIQKACRKAARLAGLDKRVTPHVLRHTFATHLLEAGSDIRVVQALLGHSHLSTTAIYIQVRSKMIAGTPSPLDLLHKPAT